MMEKELGVYISGSREVDAECELVGRLLAEMTPSVRWVIKRTPRSFEHVNPDLAQLRRSQFYLILLAVDITAPMGVEWQAAKQGGLAIMAYRHSGVIPSPAATIFARESGLRWQTYQSPQEFIRLFERDLITRLIEGTPGYGLDLADIEELSRRLKALDEADEKAQSEGGEERRGAGRGGVILPAEQR
ncbi:MAG: hypothetical protein H5T66_12350 [Chloroflexi bacterium]|nr:hypothetical protein [Chloroflexota bacterium]